LGPSAGFSQDRANRRRLARKRNLYEALDNIRRTIELHPESQKQHDAEGELDNANRGERRQPLSRSNLSRGGHRMPAPD
jgi:hypothetical protein